MANVLRSPSKVLRAGVSRIMDLTEPRTLKQKARSFLKRRKKIATNV
jgi:hypothetical protein